MSVYLQQEDLRFSLQPRSHTDLQFDDAMLRTHSSFESAGVNQLRPRHRSSDVKFYSVKPQGIAGNLTKGLVFWTRAELIHQSTKTEQENETSRREPHYEKSTPIRTYGSNSRQYSCRFHLDCTKIAQVTPGFNQIEYEGRL